jgi:hypothetical protein
MSEKTQVDHKAYMVDYARDAQRAAELLADELMKAAEEIRLLAQFFQTTALNDRRRISPTALAAEIAGRLVHGTGCYGAQLETMLYNAGKAEQHLVLHRASEKEDE